MVRTIVSIACALSFAPAAASAGYLGSPAAKKAAKTGRVPLKELEIDLEGDGAREVAVVEKIGAKLRVALFARTGKVDDEDGGYRLLTASSAHPARRVVRLEAMQLVGRAAPELVVVLEEPTPDEAALTVVVMGAEGGPPHEMFSKTFFIPRSPKEAPNTVAFGDATPHYVVEDLDDDGQGDKEIVWTREPQTLKVPGSDGKPVTFVIGAYRTIYRYEPGRGVYAMVEERDVLDFLEAKSPDEVSATAQVKEIWGTAQPFWGTDGDLATAWKVERRSAVGQSLTVRFEGRPDVNLIRVVPGCAGGEEAWEAHDRVQALKVELGSGVRFEIDTERLTDLPDAIRAAAEFPLEGGWGSQVLIFLRRPQAVPWARVEVVRIEPSDVNPKSQKRVACISEISFH